MRRNPLWYVVATIFLSSSITGYASYRLADEKSAERDRLWCDTLITLTEGYTAPANTPPSERGVRLARNLDAVRSGYHCPDQTKIGSTENTPTPASSE